MTQENLRSGLLAAAAAIVLAAASTFGDWLWANFIPDGAVLPGVIHGLLFFLLLAVLLAFALGTPMAWRRLLPTLPLIGLLLAAAFYPIAMAVGYIAGLLVTWTAMWLLLSVLLRWAQPTREPLAVALLRGGTAALLSGLSFWAISGIWTDPATAADPLSLQRFGAWTFAFLPGMFALLSGQRVRSSNL